MWPVCHGEVEGREKDSLRRPDVAMPLEDDLCDILKKARTGQGLSVGTVARMTGLPGHDVTALERGDQPRDRTEVRALATALGLRASALERITLDKWEPVTREPPPWIETIRGSINGYGVQGYVVHDGGEAVVIDTAYNAPAILEFIRQHGLRLVAICLTHGHADHAEGIDRLLAHADVPVYLGPEDATLLHWAPRRDRLAVPSEGQAISVGRYTICCMMTPGHTPGGVCYRLDDPQPPCCFVGDTLFAGSIGRSNPSRLYVAHLRSVRERLLALSCDYRLFPGHGPATTVEEERLHNPFYMPTSARGA